MIGIACWVCFLWQLQSQASSLSVAITPNDVLNEFTEQKSHKKPSRLEKLSLDNRPDIIQGKVAPRDLKHKVVIVRKQNNLPLLERMLMDVSNPKSAKYGKHLTKSQISKITSNNGATVAIKEFLLGQGILEINSTRYDDYIIAEAPISEWERILSAQFYEFEHINVKGKKFVRSMQYTIPPSLEDHVAAIFNTVQLPDHHFGKRLKFEPRPQSVSTMASGSVVPSLLNSFYNIGSNTGNNLTDQAVYAILDQTLSPSDLATFQQQFGLPLQPIASEVGGRVDDNACSLDINDCMEANLDVQYVMAVAQAVPTIYYYWTGNDVWLDWIVSVADLEDPPDLFTISYGSYEIAFDPEYLEAFKNEAIKLGLAGTTLLAASGDDGVAGFQARSGGGVPCGYYASFPASCPYVTAVGGTMGPEDNLVEVACQSDLGSSITTGGGFSHYYTLPPWQASEVADYFEHVIGTSDAPQPGYNPAMRGYPDVSMLANKYQVAAGGSFYLVSGTSASSPVMAGMVALVNSARRANGNSTLGWLNPALYALYPAFANDIISGDNKCLTSGQTCCAQGFICSPGWDPVTGLGSVNFENFKNAMMNINGEAFASIEPSSAPTLAPGYKSWVLYEGFTEQNCPAEDHSVLYTQSGFPTEQCMVLHDSNNLPVGSSKYSCTFGMATKRLYSDTICSDAAQLSDDDISYVCRNYPASSSIARSVQVRCATAFGHDLPLPTGQYVVERNFNGDVCADNTTSSFNSWKANLCFRAGGDSFMFSTDMVVNSYNDIDCAEKDLESSRELSESCEARDLSTLQAGQSTTDVSVYYQLSELTEDDGTSDKFLGLSFAAAIATGVALFFVITLLLFFLCCACFRRKRSDQTTAPK